MYRSYSDQSVTTLSVKCISNKKKFERTRKSCDIEICVNERFFFFTNWISEFNHDIDTLRLLSVYGYRYVCGRDILFKYNYFFSRSLAQILSMLRTSLWPVNFQIESLITATLRYIFSLHNFFRCRAIVMAITITTTLCAWRETGQATINSRSTFNRSATFFSKTWNKSFEPRTILQMAGKIQNETESFDWLNLLLILIRTIRWLHIVFFFC